MQQYISAALALAAVSLLSLLLFPSGEGKSKKSFELALSILALAILARPLAALRLPTLPSPEYRPPALDELLSDAEAATLAELERAVAEGVAADITAKFSLPTGALRAKVTLSLGDAELTITRLSLSLSPTAAFVDPITLRDYARRTYTENCEVTTDAR